MHYCQYGIVNTPAAFRRYLFRGVRGHCADYVPKKLQKRIFVPLDKRFCMRYTVAGGIAVGSSAANGKTADKSDCRIGRRAAE